MIKGLVVLALCALGYVRANGDTLVLVDDLATEKTHSIFFNSMRGKLDTRVFSQDDDRLTDNFLNRSRISIDFQDCR